MNRYMHVHERSLTDGLLYLSLWKGNLSRVYYELPFLSTRQRIKLHCLLVRGSKGLTSVSYVKSVNVYLRSFTTLVILFISPLIWININRKFNCFGKTYVGILLILFSNVMIKIAHVNLFFHCFQIVVCITQCVDITALVTRETLPWLKLLSSYEHRGLTLR